MKKRYPGPRPFSYDERELFYGREHEIEYVSTLIINNRTTVLHGKSGYGKTSLLNAGVVPYLLKSLNCEIIRVRFYNYDKKKKLSPGNTLLQALRIQQSSDELFLHKLVESSEVSAWRYFKKLQANALKKVKVGDEETIISSLTYILLFDQFEELFTYPKEHVHQFGKELCDLLQNRIPREYQIALKKAFNNKENEAISYHRDELSILEKEVPVKIIFSIRGDRFNYLNYLTSFIPGLLNNSYKLRRMTESQVRTAIIEPAMARDEFISPQFEYDPKLLEHIIEFLSSSKEEDKKIEVFEMQIICGKLENIIIKYFRTAQTTSKIILTEAFIVEKEKITDSKKLFIEIIKSYYIQSIQSIEEEEELLASRYLIERKLIDTITNSRVSLDHAFVKRVGICNETLTYLIDKRIVRMEVNSVSGRSYELSHGSLVIPISESSKELGNLDKLLNTFFNKSIHSFEKKEKKRITKALYDLLPNNGEDELNKQPTDPDIYEYLKSNPTILTINLSANEDEDVNKMLIKETFLQSIQESKNSSQERNVKSWAKRSKLTILGSILVVAVLLLLINYFNKKANRNYGLVYVAYSTDTISNRTDALQLVKYIYDKKWNTSNEKLKIQSKLLELLKTPDVQAKFSVLTDTLPTANLKYEDMDISPSGQYLVAHFYNDSDTSRNAGRFKILNVDKKTTRMFNNITYSYFTNNPDILLLAKTHPSSNWLNPQFSAQEDTIILYDCKNASVSKTITLGEAKHLYPSENVAYHQNDEFDSYKVRFTASGNLLIPFIEKDQNNNLIKKAGLWFSNGNIVTWNSDMSTSISKDRKKVLSGTYLRQQRPLIRIYHENGQLLDSIQNSFFADFTPSGSVTFITAGALVLRKYNTDNSRQGVDRYLKINDKINYSYVDADEAKAIVLSKDSIYALSLKDSVQKPHVFSEPFIDLNFDWIILITRNNSKVLNNTKLIPDTLFRRKILSNEKNFYTCKDGIKKVTYNSKSDNILLLTNQNRLLLLDGRMREKAGFQLTPNDLFGFCKDGSRIFYVRDKLLCVFNNDDRLINIFHYPSANKWLEAYMVNNPLEPGKLERYNLKFNW